MSCFHPHPMPLVSWYLLGENKTKILLLTLNPRAMLDFQLN